MPEEPPEQPGTEAPEATEATETEAPSGGLDRLYERMDQMSGAQQRFMEEMTQRLAPEPEEEADDESLYYTDDGDLTEDGARALISNLVEERVQALMEPREKARMVEQRDEAFEALREDYPDLQDDAVANRVLGAAIRWAQQTNAEIVDRPEFVDVIEAFFKAEKYEEMRQTQAAEQPRPVVLESGRGARQQQRPSEPDWGDRIVKAAESLRPQI